MTQSRLRFGTFIPPHTPPDEHPALVLEEDMDRVIWLDKLGYDEAWIGEHFTAPWEPNPAPDLLIAQALLQTERIKLCPGAHLLPYHHPIELAHRVAFLDHIAQGRYMLGVGISALPTDHDLFGIDAGGGTNRRMTFESLDSESESDMRRSGSPLRRR